MENAEMVKKIRIKYHSDQIDRLAYIGGKSDWIDLRSAEEVSLKQGQFCLIDLGVSVQLPAGYEMIIAARSSAFRNYGLIQANGIGIVDESYCGDEDHLRWPCYATRDTVVHVNDRICQFRIMEHQPQIVFEEVDTLGNQARGGFGSTGLS
jgi:dUTP pyrophosphatase